MIFLASCYFLISFFLSFFLTFYVGTALCSFINSSYSSRSSISIDAYSNAMTSWSWNCTVSEPTVCEGNQTVWSHVKCDDSGRVSELTLTSLGLSGHLSSVVGLLEKLQVLDLRNNSMSGPLPSSVGGLLSLEYLDVSMNDFTGSLPTSFVKLKKLESLFLAGNAFTGAVPSRLCGLSLTSLQLYDSSNDTSDSNSDGNSGLVCYYPCLLSITSTSFGTLKNCSTGKLSAYQ